MLLFTALSTLGTAAAAQKVSTLPMRTGFYAPPTETCAAATRGQSVDGVVVRPRSLVFIDGVVDVTGITRRPDGEFVITERTEDESGRFHNLTTKVRIVSSNSFTRSVPSSGNSKSPPDSTTYRFCSATVPEDYRH